MAEIDREKYLSIMPPSRKRGSHKYHIGSTKTDVTGDIAEAAQRPGVTRGELERIAWKHAAGQGSQKKFVETFQTGIEAVRENYMKQPEGVTVTNRDEAPAPAEKADAGTN